MDVDLRLENLQNAEAFGMDAQIMQAIEEMAELIQALNKVNRYILHAKNPDPQRIKEAHEHAIEEIADVEIMMEQLEYLLGITKDTLTAIKQYKIRRSTLRRKEGREPAKTECWSCKWHDDFTWVCFNALSPCCADYTQPDAHCAAFERREENKESEDKKE